jgi:hypothetical protein
MPRAVQCGCAATAAAHITIREVLVARLRSLVRQSPAVVIATMALAFSLGGSAGYAASSASSSGVQVTFHKLTLRNGWMPSSGGVGAPSYAISAGVVYLTGAMHQQLSDTARKFAILPRGARPKHVLWIAAFSEDSTSASLEVLPSGAMLIGGKNRQFFASLAGVSFAVGS